MRPFVVVVALIIMLIFEVEVVSASFDYEGDGSYQDALAACVHCPEYIESTAAVKEKIIMGKIQATEYDYENLPEWRTLCDAVNLLEGVDFNNIFDRFSDERPAAFDRFFHFSGIIASVRFEPSKEGLEVGQFTGIFQSGANHGVLRFSPIAPLLRESYLVNHFIGTFPYSFAVKFFRDGIHSGNINVGDSAKSLKTFSGNRQFYDLPDFNIFSRVQDNMSGIADTFDPLFGEYEKFSGVISPIDAAAFDQYGNAASPLKSPIITSFRPNPELTRRYYDLGFDSDLEFRYWATQDDFIVNGVVLYGVYTTIDSTTLEPSLCVDGDGLPQVDDDVARYCPEQRVIHLGNVVANSKFFAAEWPDLYLFFQHHRMCPKDQSVCINDDDPTTEDPIGEDGTGLGNPDTTYPMDDNEFCRSSDDKSGTITGTPPGCPFGSNFKRTNCYLGSNQVPSTQEQVTCPMMDKVATSILTVSPGADTTLPPCDGSENVTNFFLNGMLAVLSPPLRFMTTYLPFTKWPVDCLIASLPFGRG